nr:LOW QUALITY PROTEIN: E3 ubiquitin-protein ligase TRIM13-like [Cherax quadricarinatus]
MDNYNPEECKVCFNNYDEELRRPRNLPCGHTFCSQCIEDTIQNAQLICPSCRAKHSATDATQFPIVYAIEAFMKKLRSIQVTSVETVSTKCGQDRTRGISKKLRSLVQEHKRSISNLISECEEALSQLSKYQGQVRDWKTQHHQLQDRLHDLLEQNKAAIELLEQEDTSVLTMTTEGEAGKKQLQTMLENLNTVNTAEEVVTTIDEADYYNVEVEDWIQKCQELFPGVNTVYTLVNVQETIKKTLDTITTETGATAASILQGDSVTAIMEKVKKIIGKPSRTLTVDDLRGMSENVKRMVEAGLVFGVKQDQDDLCYSRITLQDGQLYLHVLQHQPPPTHARTIQDTPGQHRGVRPRGSCQVCHRQCVLSSSSFNIRAHEGLGSSINLASTRTLTCP